jgi:hypothetical protein
MNVTFSVIPKNTVVTIEHFGFQKINKAQIGTVKVDIPILKGLPYFCHNNVNF